MKQSSVGVRGLSLLLLVFAVGCGKCSKTTTSSSTGIERVLPKGAVVTIN